MALQYQTYGSGGPIQSGGGVAPWLQDVGAGLGIAGDLYGLYQGAHLQGAASDVFKQSDPFAGYRPGYGADLYKLMQDPSSVTKLPGYQFLMQQGTDAINRGAAAGQYGGFGSTGEKAELMKYGQGLADQFLQQQIQTLTGLSGANIQPANPYAALQGLAGAQNIAGQSFGGLSSGLLQLMQGLTGGGRGVPQAVSGIDTQSMSDWNNYNLASGFGGNTAFGSAVGQDPTYQMAMGWMGGGTPAGSVDVGVPGDYSQNYVMADAFDSGGGGGLDLSGLFGGPRAAGGEAATSPGGLSTGSALQMGGGLAGIGLSLAGGRPGAATTGALSLASKIPGLDPTIAKNLGMAGGIGGNVLGIMQGLKAGGVSGYGQAGISAASLATKGLGATGAISGGTASEIGSALGYAAIPLSLYNFAKNWQAGSVGSDALQGVSTGAAIGSVIPGVGTLIGAGIGGIVGGLSGLIGNAGSREAAESHSINAAINKLPANQQVQAAASMNAKTATTYIQSIMSAENNSPGHSTGLEMAFGRNNVAGFTKQLDTQLTNAFRSGKIQAGATPASIYKSVVAPWLASKKASLNIGAVDSAGNNFTNTLTGAVQALIQQWMVGGG